MTIAKRFAIFAFMFTPFLFIFCLGNWVIAENMGMNKLLLDVLFWCPLLAVVLLFIGCMMKKPCLQSGICCSGLFVFGLALVALISSWGPVHARDWQPYLDVQEAEGLEVYIYYYSDQPEKSFEHAQLSFADAKQVSELLQQVKMNRPKFSFQQVRDELEAAGEPYIHFSVHTEKGWRKGGVGMCPPYYIFSDDTAYLAADEQVCQDLKALYDELLPKYIPADDGAQLAAE